MQLKIRLRYISSKIQVKNLMIVTILKHRSFRSLKKKTKHPSLKSFRKATDCYLPLNYENVLPTKSRLKPINQKEVWGERPNLKTHQAKETTDIKGEYRKN